MLLAAGGAVPSTKRLAQRLLARGWIAAVTAAALAGGCLGRIGDGGLELDEPGLESACATAEPDVEPQIARMLNRREYAHTVRDLLGAPDDVAADFPADPIVGFDNHAISLVASGLLVERHLDAAEALAAAADLAALLPCAEAAGCVDEFVASFGRRAFRRPLEPAEVAALRAIYDRARAAGRTADAAIRLVIEGALLSPQFLYRAETTVSQSGGVVPVEPYELASRLSYFLWASMPDDELLDAAEAGALGTPAEVEQQARRMLADPKARQVTKIFHELWLELYKLAGTTKLDAGFEALAPLFAEETALFTEHVFWESDAGASGYLLSETGFMNDALAEHYGAAPATGSTLGPVALDGERRFGLLTQGSVLSIFSNPDRTSPTKRGKFVRQQLLCQPPPPPPADVPPLVSGASSEGTLRERLAEHVENPACKGCHRLLDPLGFGLENYDAVGRYRTEDGGAPVDASGELIAVDEGAGTFVGARELSERLVQSDEFHACVAAQWFRFAIGRDAGPRDSCALEGVVNDFRSKGDSLPELLVAIVLSDAFLFKNTEPMP